ncbi:MAG: hypothetical protein J0626_01120, partial [Rhodospirillaceae bacterium]|nr:hypothetical protein [Rhodospirillaceae bacterium]
MNAAEPVTLVRSPILTKEADCRVIRISVFQAKSMRLAVDFVQSSIPVQAEPVEAWAFSALDAKEK